MHTIKLAIKFLRRQIKSKAVALLSRCVFVCACVCDAVAAAILKKNIEKYPPSFNMSRFDRRNSVPTAAIQMVVILFCSYEPRRIDQNPSPDPGNAMQWCECKRNNAPVASSMTANHRDSQTYIDRCIRPFLNKTKQRLMHFVSRLRRDLFPLYLLHWRRSEKITR